MGFSSRNVDRSISKLFSIGVLIERILESRI